MIQHNIQLSPEHFPGGHVQNLTNYQEEGPLPKPCNLAYLAQAIREDRSTYAQIFERMSERLIAMEEVNSSVMNANVQLQNQITELQGKINAS